MFRKEEYGGGVLTDALLAPCDVEGRLEDDA